MRENTRTPFESSAGTATPAKRRSASAFAAPKLSNDRAIFRAAASGRRASRVRSPSQRSSAIAALRLTRSARSSG